MKKIKTDSGITLLEKERICETYEENIFEEGDLKREVREEFGKNKGKGEEKAQQTVISEVVR